MTRRLLASMLGLTLLVLVVLEVPLAATVADRERDQLRSSIERDAVVLASYVEDQLQGGMPVDAPPVARYADDTGARVVVVSAAGVGVLDTDRPDGAVRTFATRPEIRRALAGEVATGTRHSDTLGTDLLYVAVPVASGGVVHGAVRVTFPTTAVDERVARFWWGLAGVGVISLVAASVLGSVIAVTVSRPLRRLRDDAAAIGRGELDRRAGNVGGPPVVRSLAAAFDDMAARLEALVQTQEEFVADASHQLRNPLTALRLRLENLEADVSTGAAHDLHGALDEVARLSRLTDGLLALARADREGAPPLDRPIDVVPLVEGCRRHWSVLADERDVDITVDDPSHAVPALATEDRLRQVLDNVVGNALDVAPPGSRIELRIDDEPGAVVLHVVDQGPGMSAAARARAFDRLWRGTTGGSELGGAGLGLHIARKLVVADGGAIELVDGPDGGLEVVVRLRHPQPA